MSHCLNGLVPLMNHPILLPLDVDFVTAPVFGLHLNCLHPFAERHREILLFGEVEGLLADFYFEVVAEWMLGR